MIKTEQVKHSVLNANAKMGRHHVMHHRHHRFHKRMGALKTHPFSKVAIKHVDARRQARLNRSAGGCRSSRCLCGYPARPVCHGFPNGAGPVPAFVNMGAGANG